MINSENSSSLAKSDGIASNAFGRHLQSLGIANR
jgi:hypothetical protein